MKEFFTLVWCWSCLLSNTHKNHNPSTSMFDSGYSVLKIIGSSPPPTNIARFCVHKNNIFTSKLLTVLCSGFFQQGDVWGTARFPSFKSSTCFVDHWFHLLWGQRHDSPIYYRTDSLWSFKLLLEILVKMLIIYNILNNGICVIIVSGQINLPWKLSSLSLNGNLFVFSLQQKNVGGGGTLAQLLLHLCWSA